MARATIDGIETEYEVRGDGPPLLMFSPGGFDATMEKWWTLGIYAKTHPVDHLAKHYRCILFDRRECGKSGGRVERVTWADYAQQGKGLLDHLGIDRAHLIGGCMGVSPVIAFATSYPDMLRSMILYWPVGGTKYRINGHQRFADHLGFANTQGLEAVVALVKEGGKSFSGDPRGGPWASSIRNDPTFAENYAKIDLADYRLIVAGMVRGLLDRDTAPGAEPEDMLRCRIPALVIPGADAAHATSAARYLAECLPASDYWDVPVAEQTEEATAQKLLGFLKAQG
jgi:pimeloyl-ACP methyl ester carboxylesterase